ncbi:MAG: hypothetical protein QF440_07370 [Candidatus Thalassarchaeaceae archaeon]|nr:hypothetical protein [Candidatus Thalassarchaeaceae archaeon]
MSLKALSEEIETRSKSEAKAIADAAKKQAKGLKKEADSEVAEIRDQLLARAERESAQLSNELVASARQNNQKRELIAKAAELDATWEAVVAEVGSAKLKGRADLLKALVAEAKKAGSKDMKLLPVSIDRKAIEKVAKGFDIGNDVDGLGGFMLESNDGSVVLDFRFDARLETAWKSSLGDVSSKLFD